MQKTINKLNPFYHIGQGSYIHLHKEKPSITYSRYTLHIRVLFLELLPELLTVT